MKVVAATVYRAWYLGALSEVTTQDVESIKEQVVVLPGGVQVPRETDRDRFCETQDEAWEWLRQRAVQEAEHAQALLNKARMAENEIIRKAEAYLGHGYFSRLPVATSTENPQQNAQRFRVITPGRDEIHGADLSLSEARTGYAPVDDDIERVNCDQVGKIGHQQCGWCKTCNGPRFQRSHLARSAS